MDNRGSHGRRSYSALCNGRCLETAIAELPRLTIASPHTESFDDSRTRDSDRPPRRSAPEADPTKPSLRDAITRAPHAPPDAFAAGRWVSLCVDLAEFNGSPVELAVEALGSRYPLHRSPLCGVVLETPAGVRPSERVMFRRNGSE